MSEKRSISFIIASFNEQESIVQTIESIASIAADRDELIVVDGASTDSTVKLAREALSNNSSAITSRVISEPDTGIYNAWNKAIKISHGEWLCFVGCGDLLEPSFRQQMFTDVPDKANFIHCKASFYDPSKKLNSTPSKTVGKVLSKDEFVQRMSVCHVASLHHRSLFDQFTYSENYRCVSDYHFLLRNLERLVPVFKKHVLVRIKTGGISMVDTVCVKELFHMQWNGEWISKIAALQNFIMTYVKFTVGRYIRKTKAG